MAAVLWLQEWQWEEARKEFDRSLNLSPRYPTGNHWQAEFVMTMGQHSRAIAKMRSSQELDPLSLIIHVALGWALYMARRYDESIEQLKRTIALDPNYPVAYWILGQVYSKIGAHDLAIAAGEKSIQLSGGSLLMSAALAQSYGASGKKENVLKILFDLTEQAKYKYVAPHFFAGVHLGLGDEGRALDYLEKSYEERCHWLIYLHIDPSMDRLRNNPRFHNLLQGIGLPATMSARIA